MKPWLDDGDIRMFHGDVRDVLRELPEQSVQTCVTSPPYWGLRDYGTEGQIGLEPTPDAYVAAMVAVFREVWRVLRDDGTLWLNLGDSYAGAGYGNHSINGPEWHDAAGLDKRSDRQQTLKRACAEVGIKPKDLCGIPWMVAFALRADGWYLRSDIVWSKSNPMPESVTDRPTKAHEYVFLLAKRPRYFYDADAIREAAVWAEWDSRGGRAAAGTTWDERVASGAGSGDVQRGQGGVHGNRKGYERTLGDPANGRNARSVWDIATQPTPEAHFATYPEELVRRCILAGTSEAGECSACGAPWHRQVEREPVAKDRPSGKGWLSSTEGIVLGRSTEPNGGLSRGEYQRSETTGWLPSCDCANRAIRERRTVDWQPCRPQLVLDPFVGSGTTCLVARRHGRRSIGVDVSEDYLRIAANRTRQLSLLT